MSEMNVYGGIVWSSSGYDTGIDNQQYAIFKLKPEFINGYENTRMYYLLKDIASATQNVMVGFTSSTITSANYRTQVRPRFLIG